MVEADLPFGLDRRFCIGIGMADEAAVVIFDVVTTDSVACLLLAGIVVVPGLVTLYNGNVARVAVADIIAGFVGIVRINQRVERGFPVDRCGKGTQGNEENCESNHWLPSR